MSSLSPSPLEQALLARFHELYADQGFPSPDKISVRARDNTGGGRYVDLECSEITQMDDGYLDLNGGYIKMSGVPYGMMAVVRIKDHRPEQIEIAVYGEDGWDGEERDWQITRAAHAPG